MELYPAFARNAFAWYLKAYRDPLVGISFGCCFAELHFRCTTTLSVVVVQMTLLPAWFRVLCWSELYVQLPFFFVAAYAHALGKAWIQKPTIVYGIFVAATMVCILGELLLAPDAKHPRLLLAAFYFPYLIFPLAMAIRMLITDHPFVAGVRNDKKLS